MDLFHDITGQDRAIALLKAALGNNKVHHAYLFTGPEGVGKSLVARAFAASLCCPDLGCGECDSCRRFMAKRFHPDIHDLTCAEGKRTIGVESVREMESLLSLSAAGGVAKVLIIDPADRMTPAAENALLKTLEEPPPSTYLLLVTSRPWSLVSTVRSRCQRVRFSPLASETVERILSGTRPEEEKQIRPAASQSQGSVAKALWYLDNDIAKLYPVLSEVLDRLKRGAQLQVLAAALAPKKDRDTVAFSLEILLLALRELLLCGAGHEALSGGFFPPEDRRHLLKAWDRASILRAMELAEEALDGLERNQAPMLTLEAMLATMQSEISDRTEG